MADLLELQPLAREADLGRQAYGRFLKPRVAEVLETVALDVAYDRAEGDYLYYRQGDGTQVRVLDLLGGYGASFVGHNNPLLVARATELLQARRPFNAQASVRALAGRLAERLSERVKRATGKDYVVTLASTGAESVEAAIKHAEMDLIERVDGIVAGLARTRKAFNVRRREGTAHVPHRTLERASKLLGGPPLERADDLFTRVEEHAARVFDTEPTFLTLDRGFHGKLTGALSLTANPTYRRTWRRIGLRTVFLTPGDHDQLDRAVNGAHIRYIDLVIGEDGALEAVVKILVNVVAAFVEPIQGEGGVRVLTDDYLRSLRAKADESGFLLIFDEIQCGMGRTGTFLASEPSGVHAEYYLLSKSLGGGLAKISALLVEQGRYSPEFGMLHTSTFAEDDFASAVGLGVLEILDHDDGALLRAARKKGLHLRARLDAIKAEYPEQIEDVRGRGLMIGLQFKKMDRSASPFLRVASEQDLLGYVVAGYLLHEDQIRVMPTLSSPETIRIQPSALVSTDELDRFADAVQRLTRAMRELDTERITRYLVGRVRSPLQSARYEPDPTASMPPPSLTVRAEARRVAFLGHFLDPEDVRDWDPGFATLTDEECAKLVDRTRRVLGPFITHVSEIRSRTGSAVELTVIGIPFSSEQVMQSYRSGGAAWARAMIDEGLELARSRGATVVGFGGYTSIVTDNCRDVVEDEILVTSGNSLTSAAAVEAVLAATARLGLGSLRLGVVGALGNIGAVLAEVLSDHVDRIVLVGRHGAQRRLEEREGELYSAALARWSAEGKPRGIAAVMSSSPLKRQWQALAGGMALDDEAGGVVTRLMQDIAFAAAKDAIKRALEHGGEGLGPLVRGTMGKEAPIVVSTDMSALRECNVIVAATNSPRPVILPEHLGPGPVLVCDVAAPGDVHPDVARARPDVSVIKGGMVRLPLGRRLRIRGMPTREGEIYGCLGETLLMGLAGVTEGLSVGKLTARHVRRARDLAVEHGFSFGEKPTHDRRV